jgi:hypothetical protein
MDAQPNTNPAFLAALKLAMGAAALFVTVLPVVIH